uniref:Uncharacterized protein n=1 Tax=Nelumbo nucifera TaxID=4432 RepID=A0A822Y3Z9_NELNU|nr:TPA_asm: hypothetical protein HUJ06_028191 [Nelumbo nucifera]
MPPQFTLMVVANNLHICATHLFLIECLHENLLGVTNQSRNYTSIRFHFNNHQFSVVFKIQVFGSLLIYAHKLGFVL